MIYLDNAATTINKPEGVAKAVYDAIRLNKFGNPSRGSYPQSLDALKELIKVRSSLANFFGGDDPLKVVLTPNISFGLNFIIKSLFSKGDHIISSITEHNSVLRPLYDFEKHGGQLSLLDMDENFNIKLEDLPAILKENTKAVVITGGSNVSGKLTDLKKVNDFTLKYGLKLIVDGAQISGCIPFSLKDYDNIIFAFTGHKSLHGPQGTGGFIVKGDFDFKQVFSGGSGFDSFSQLQPNQLPELFEPGTANVHSFAGLRAAIEDLESNKEENYKKLQNLTKLLYKGLKENKNLIFYTQFEEKNAPIVSFNIKNANANEVGQILWDEYEICVRSGSHCAPLFHEKMGTRERGIVRLSLSTYNTEDEVKQAIKAIEEIADSFK